MNDSAIAAATGSLLVSLLLAVGFYAWVALALQAVFAKTGEEGWKAWVPILNGVTLLRMGGLSGWWMLLLVVPPAGIVLYALTVVACHRLNTGFGYGGGMTVLAALLFPVWASVVGWSSNRWIGAAPGGVHRSGPVRTGAPAHAAPAPRPQALAWHTGAPGGATPGFASSGLATPPLAGPASAAPARLGAPAPPATPTATPAPPATSTAATLAAASISTPAPAPVTSVPLASVPGREPRLISPEPEAVRDDLDDLRARHRAPFTGTTPVVRLGDPEPAAEPSGSDAPAAPRPAVAADETDLAVDSPVSATPVPAPVREEPVDAAPGDPAAPVSAPRVPEVDPWAPPATRPPLRSAEPYGFSDTSGEVSAVAGAPVLGSPMSARSSVSSLGDGPELPDAESAFDETILVARKRTAWKLMPPLGAPIAVTQDVVIIGRRPSFDPAFPSAQLVSIADETRTMSKTHARLERRDAIWVITDLDSTNGVVLIDLDGTEIEVAPGRPMPVVERFLLGDAELALARDNA